MSKLLPRLIAVLFSVACCSPSWAQLSIDASCDTTTVQCLADLDAITCDAPDLLGSEGEVIGTASCLLVSERDSFREICTASTANPISGSNAGALVMYNIQMTSMEWNSEYYEPTGAGLDSAVGLRIRTGHSQSGTVQGVERSLLSSGMCTSYTRGWLLTTPTLQTEAEASSTMPAVPRVDPSHRGLGHLLHERRFNELPGGCRYSLDRIVCLEPKPRAIQPILRIPGGSRSERPQLQLWSRWLVQLGRVPI